MVTDSPWDECVPGQALIKEEEPGGDPLTFVDTWEPIGRTNARKIRPLPAWATFHAVGVRGERDSK